MGLDQYAYIKSDDKDTELAFVWRKHAKLQAFMENLWTAKTSQPAGDLNCAELKLQEADVDVLQGLVEAGNLPKSFGGFFFGHQAQNEAAAEYAEYDAQFCEWAKEQLAAGKTVIYSCWW